MATDSRISPTGTISRRISRKKMNHRRATAGMVRAAFMDITDGDADNRAAASILMHLEELFLYEYDVEERQYDGDWTGAEKSCDLYLLREESK